MADKEHAYHTNNTADTMEAGDCKVMLTILHKARH